MATWSVSQVPLEHSSARFLCLHLKLLALCAHTAEEGVCKSSRRRHAGQALGTCSSLTLAFDWLTRATWLDLTAKDAGKWVLMSAKEQAEGALMKSLSRSACSTAPGRLDSLPVQLFPAQPESPGHLEVHVTACLCSCKGDLP